MKQRTSSRTIKLSKAFKVVDHETRRAIAEQRLLALEHDNYNEQEVVGEGADDNYASDDSAAPRKKRAKKDNGRGKGTAAGSRSLTWLNRPPKNLERVMMDNGLSPDISYSLVAPPETSDEPQPGPRKITYAQLCQNKGWNFDSVNYYSVAARFTTTSTNTVGIIGATTPYERSRHFCAVCGYLGDYACTRCGARSCSLRCQTSHQETRCLNQSM